jgi:single-stranded DNA-binding protein
MTGMACKFEGEIISDITNRTSSDGSKFISSATVKYTEYDGKTNICMVSTFGNSAEFMSNNFKKGDTVTVDGCVNLNVYTDKNGQEKAGLSVKAITVKPINKNDKTT